MEDHRIKLARKLMIDVTRDAQALKKERENNTICECGHKHKDHTHTYSINFTAGFCMIKGCKCRNFLINETNKQN